MLPLPLTNVLTSAGTPLILLLQDCLTSLIFQVCKPALKRSYITLRKIRSINKKLLRDEISNTDLWKNLLSYNLDSLVNAYNNTLKSVLDNHTPAITKTVIKRPTVPWFNDGVKSAKKEKRRVERKWC